MRDCKIVALDLDGTTLTDSKTITDNTVLWIQRAVDAGIIVMFATGRGIQGTREYWEYVGLTGPMVLVNGGEIWEAPGKLLERNLIDSEDIHRLHQLAVANNARFWGYSVENFVRQEDWTDKVFEHRWLRFSIQHDNINKIEELREAVRSWEILEVTRSASTNLEVTPKGITKAYGMKKVCELLGVDMKNVIAIGDSLNDLQLIQSAGLGIAMGNADNIVKQVADGITDTNEREGVAKAIEKYLF